MSDTSQPIAEPTREEKAHKLDQVLVETNGDRKFAAEVMGMTTTQVAALIDGTAALRVKWGVGERQVPETEIEVIDRKPIAAPLVKAEQTINALVAQEKSLARPLSRIGFKSKEIEAIQAMEEFAGQQFERTLSILHGALLKSSMRLSLMAEHIEETYLRDPGLDDRTRNQWWNTYFKLLENLRLQNDTAFRAALTRAVIKQKVESKEAGGTSGKPGFSSLTAIQVNIKDQK